MAKEAMITRTIITTEAVIMTVDLTTQEVADLTITLPRTYKDDNALLKQAEKTEALAGKKAVLVKSSTTVETLYGMTESDFIAHAEVQDDTKRKEYKANKEAKKAQQN